MQSSTQRSLQILSDAKISEEALYQTELTPILAHLSKQQDGLFPILKLAKKHPALNSSPAILDWIKNHGDLEKFVSQSFTLRNDFFLLLAYELHITQNRFAHYFKKELIQHWNKSSLTLSDYFCLELDFHEKNTLLDILPDSAEVYDKHIYCQIQLRANILFRTRTTEEIDKLDLLHGCSFDSEAIKFLMQQTHAAPHFTPLLEDIFIRNGGDQLLALETCLKQQATTNAPAILCLCLKILILTADAKKAAERFHLPQSKIHQLKEDVVQLLIPFQQSNEIFQQFCQFTLKLTSNPKLPLTMCDHNLHTDTVIVAAILNDPKITEIAKGKFLNLYAKGLTCLYPLKNVDTTRLAEIGEQLVESKLTTQSKSSPPPAYVSRGT